MEGVGVVGESQSLAWEPKRMLLGGGGGPAQFVCWGRGQFFPLVSRDPLTGIRFITRFLERVAWEIHFWAPLPPPKKLSSSGLEVSPGHFELPETNIMVLKGPSHLRVTCWCILKGPHHPGSHISCRFLCIFLPFQYLGCFCCC